MYESAKFRKLKRQVGDDWEDIVQEATINCMRYVGQPYYNKCLTKTIYNEAYTFLHKRRKDNVVSLDERDKDGPKTFNILEYSYLTDFGAIYDLNRFMISRWDEAERNIIFLFFTKQITVRYASGLLGKPLASTYRWLMNVKKTFHRGLSDYA